MVNDAMTLTLSTLRAIYFFPALIFATVPAVRLRFVSCQQRTSCAVAFESSSMSVLVHRPISL